MPNLWVKQLSSVVNRTACRSIIASLVEWVNASSGDALTSGVQRDDHLAAKNSFAAINFIEDMERCIYIYD